MDLPEAYSGSDLAGWHGKIERHLIELRDKYEAQHNRAYTDKVGEFLRLWRSYPIEGSINIEALTPLDAAASQLAVDDWKLASYFSSLRDKVRQVIASVQELPDFDSGFEPSGRGKRMGSGGSGGPPSTFGPEKKPGGSEMPKGTEDLDDGPDPLKPEAGKPGKPGFGDSIAVARRVYGLAGMPVPMNEVQTDPVLQEALGLGWLDYNFDTGYYYVAKLDEVTNAAYDYDVGDEVVVAYDGKPVKGTVAKRRPDGSFELSFDDQDKNRPMKPVTFKKDQLRHPSNTKPPAQHGKTPNSPAARQFYGMAGSRPSPNGA